MNNVTKKKTGEYKKKLLNSRFSFPCHRYSQSFLRDLRIRPNNFESSWLAHLGPFKIIFKNYFNNLPHDSPTEIYKQYNICLKKKYASNENTDCYKYI